MLGYLSVNKTEELICKEGMRNLISKNKKHIYSYPSDLMSVDDIHVYPLRSFERMDDLIEMHMLLHQSLNHESLKYIGELTFYYLQEEKSLSSKFKEQINKQIHQNSCLCDSDYKDGLYDALNDILDELVKRDLMFLKIIKDIPSIIN